MPTSKSYTVGGKTGTLWFYAGGILGGISNLYGARINSVYNTGELTATYAYGIGQISVKYLVVCATFNAGNITATYGYPTFPSSSSSIFASDGNGVYFNYYLYGKGNRTSVGSVSKVPTQMTGSTVFNSGNMPGMNDGFTAGATGYLPYLSGFGDTSCRAELTNTFTAVSTHKYLIKTDIELNLLAKLVNNGERVDTNTLFSECSYYLVNNITVSSYTPIGTSSFPFKGTFQGGESATNYGIDKLRTITISSLASSESSNGCPGIFGYVSGTAYNGGVNYAKIRYISRAGSSISIKKANAGGIVGKAEYANISYCENNTVINTSWNIVGGIVGYAINSTIENCKNHVSITGRSYVGGIVGLATGSTISGTKAKDAIYYGEDWNLANYADISGYSDVGGIVGEARNSNITTAFAGTITNSIIKITATSGTVGGIAGNAIDSGYSIRDCYVYKCYIKAVDSSNVWHNYAGGVLGFGNITIDSCTVDAIMAEGYKYSGVIAGCCSGTITECSRVSTSIRISHYHDNWLNPPPNNLENGKDEDNHERQ